MEVQHIGVSECSVPHIHIYYLWLYKFTDVSIKPNCWGVFSVVYVICARCVVEHTMHCFISIVHVQLCYVQCLTENSKATVCSARRSHHVHVLNLTTSTRCARTASTHHHPVTTVMAQQGSSVLCPAVTLCAHPQLNDEHSVCPHGRHTPPSSDWPQPSCPSHHFVLCYSALCGILGPHLLTRPFSSHHLTILSLFFCPSLCRHVIFP